MQHYEEIAKKPFFFWCHCIMAVKVLKTHCYRWVLAVLLDRFKIHVFGGRMRTMCASKVSFVLKVSSLFQALARSGTPNARLEVF